MPMQAPEPRGLARFGTVQSPENFRSGTYLYYLDEVWDCFKPLVTGKDRDEIYNILSECDRTRWEFESYIFSVDDPQEIIPGSESFDRLVDILSEVEQYQRQFNIAANGYFQEFEATCQFQLELMQGQARPIPNMPASMPYSRRHSALPPSSGPQESGWKIYTTRTRK
ncbi:hypothetical protein [Azotobacter chroococcum]|uniref:hypothetical protein n=1 Tax=Azotobacter chroococcum TaxID=353 RepID=UPI000589F215|nr:hypothetical protein [Azotobacter chroococcum]